MKHWREIFCREVKAWDRVHRIIGQESPEQLFKESLQSFENSKTVWQGKTCLVDIGAGSGVLGWAWMSLSPSHCCAFVEPKKKSASFLQLMASHLSPEERARIRVIPQAFEHVSRETLSSFISGTVSRETMPATPPMPNSNGSETVSRETSAAEVDIIGKLVSRETLFASRAFSGPKELDQVMKESAFADQDVYVFRRLAGSQNSPYCLVPLGASHSGNAKG